MKKSLSLLLAVILVCNFFCIVSLKVRAEDSNSYILDATIRDFDPVNNEHPERNHPDFENEAYFDTSTTGAVKAVLGADGTPVYADSGFSQKIITSEESFYDWYHDTPKNVNIPYSMVFNKSGEDYIFDSTLTDGFFPINNMGFGNYQDNKNYHFTLELHAKFVYKPGQVFSIAGDDDLWLFVNGKIVGDMGGIHKTQDMTVNLDDHAMDLGLVPDGVYALDVFFAERHVTESNLKIFTNIILKTNDRPIADAGEDQSKRTDGSTAVVTLDGSKSTDPDGDELTYTWTNEEGTTIGTTATPSVELPAGENTLTLTVSDGELTSTDTVVITVTVNGAPVADAGEDQNKRTDGSTAVVTLDGSKSIDPDGDELTYTWTNEEGTTIGTTVKPDVELPVGKNTLTLTVSDGTKTSTDTVVITVTGNGAPVADAGEDQNKRTDEKTAKVTLDGSKSTDPDGDELTYTWTNEAGTTIGSTVKPDVELPVGKNTLTLTVSDGTKTSTDTVVITVTGNGAPVADAGEDQNKRTDGKTAKVTLDGSKSTDPDGDELTYTWTNEAGTTVGTTVKPVVELPVGKNTLTLTVSDGTETSTDTVVITVEKKKSSGGSNPGNSVREQENRPPVANAGEDQVVLTARGTEAVTMDGSKSSDPDGDELTYIWEDEEGERVGTTEKPIVDLPVGKNILKLTVSDGKLSSSDSVVIIVNKEEIPSGAGTTADVAISLTSDQMRVEENKEFVLSMKYINKTDSVVKNVYIEFDLPEDMQVIDLSEGKQSGNRIIWEIGDLDAKKTGQIDLKVKSNEIQQADIIKKFVSTIFSRDTELVNTYDDSSQLGIMIYSNRFNHVHKRYILGYPDKTFKGLRNITRAETAVIFARILDLKELTITNKNQFVDVKPGHWAEAHIYAVVQVELFKGVDSTHFDPDVPISRAELATVIANYLKISRTVDQKPFEVSFNDTKNHWAQGNIEEVVRHKIVNGYEDGSFKPEKKISRQEAVAMINRLLNRGPLTKVNNSFPDMTSEHWAFGDVEESVRTHEFIINDNGVEEMTKFIDESIW